MVSLGKLYTYEKSWRAYKALIAAKYNNVTIDVVPNFQFGVTNKTPDFLKKFPLGKVPAFETADGHFICESNAIAAYVAYSKPDTLLCPQTHLGFAEGAQFTNMADFYLVPASGTWIGGIEGYCPFDAKTTEKAKQDVKHFMETFNKYLLTRTFLVANHVTLPDIIVFCSLLQLYQMVMEPSFREPYGNVNRWFNTMLHQAEVRAVVGEVTLCTKMAVHDPTKAAKTAAVPAKKPAKANDDDEDNEFADAPKPKSPLDLLPPSKFNLEDWKRFYSNNETRPTALNYLWEKFDKEGYAFWRCEYKYNEELTKLFMTANLIGGFFQRLEEARKYAFGTMCILGKDNDSKVAGYFIFRGQDIPEMVRECPDFDSYSFTKVNHEDAATRKDIEHYLAWDVANFAEGKTYK